jgi:hypothetical protein
MVPGPGTEGGTEGLVAWLEVAGCATALEELDSHSGAALATSAMLKATPNARGSRRGDSATVELVALDRPRQYRSVTNGSHEEAVSARQRSTPLHVR